MTIRRQKFSLFLDSEFIRRKSRKKWEFLLEREFHKLKGQIYAEIFSPLRTDSSRLINWIIVVERCQKWHRSKTIEIFWYSFYSSRCTSYFFDFSDRSARQRFRRVSQMSLLCGLPSQKISQVCHWLGGAKWVVSDVRLYDGDSALDLYIRKLKFPWIFCTITSFWSTSSRQAVIMTARLSDCILGTESSLYNESVPSESSEKFLTLLRPTISSLITWLILDKFCRNTTLSSSHSDNVVHT